MNFKSFSLAISSVGFLFLFNSCNVEPIDPVLAEQIGIPVSDDESADITTAVYKWSFKLDGVLYEWQGNHILNSNSGGQSTYSIKSIALQKTNSSNLPIITVGITFPSASTGDFIFNSLNSNAANAFQITIINNNGSTIDKMYSTTSGGTMNVNISSLSNVTLYSNPLYPGKVIGTFSGTIKPIIGSTNIATITEGSFEAIRGQ